MRTSNMGIPAAATAFSDPVAPPTRRETPSFAQTRQPGTPIGGEHSIPVPRTTRMAPSGPLAAVHSVTTARATGALTYYIDVLCANKLRFIL